MEKITKEKCAELKNELLTMQNDYKWLRDNGMTQEADELVEDMDLIAKQIDSYEPEEDTSQM